MPIPTHKSQKVPVDLDLGNAKRWKPPNVRGGGIPMHSGHRLGDTTPGSTMRYAPKARSGGGIPMHKSQKIGQVEDYAGRRFTPK